MLAHGTVAPAVRTTLGSALAPRTIQRYRLSSEFLRRAAQFAPPLGFVFKRVPARKCRKIGATGCSMCRRCAALNYATVLMTRKPGSKLPQHPPRVCPSGFRIPLTLDVRYRLPDGKIHRLFLPGSRLPASITPVLWIMADWCSRTVIRHRVIRPIQLSLVLLITGHRRPTRRFERTSRRNSEERAPSSPAIRLNRY